MKILNFIRMCLAQVRNYFRDGKGDITEEDVSSDELTDSVMPVSEINSIPITQDNLSRIIPGMIWYEDDTVSEELIEDKIVKSVVLFIKEGVVYDDTFVDTESSWHGSYKLIEKFTNKYVAEGEAYWMTCKDFDVLAENINTINSTLRILDKPLWRCYWKDFYWSCTESTGSYAWKILLPNDAYNMYKGEIEYIRPVMVYKVEK